MPTFCSPLKTSSLLDPPTRMRLLREALEVFVNKKKCIISDHEVLKNSPSYTVDTLSWLIKKHPGNSWFFLLGSDSLKQLKKWHSYSQLITMCEWVVALRDKDTESDINTYIKKHLLGIRYHFLELKKHNISSTTIRNTLSKGMIDLSVLPKGVGPMIREELL
jgi:nicotinate-nucleotide adenylyltransferase